MVSAVKVSIMALRILWALNLALGIYVAFFGGGSAWANTHMATGLLVVILLFFLGIPQAVVKGGSLALTTATFIVGLALALIGMAQVAVSNAVALAVLQTLHVLLVIATIALAEICARRYLKGLDAQAAQ